VGLGEAAIFHNGRRRTEIAQSNGNICVANLRPSGNSVNAQQLCKGLLSAFTNLSGWSGV